MKQLRWTPEDEQEVKEHVRIYGTSEGSLVTLARRLGRSFMSVQNKVYRTIDVSEPGAVESGTIVPKLGTALPPTPGASLRDRFAIEPGLVPTKHADASKPATGKPGALEPILIVSDAHIPYHSRPWWSLLMQVGRAIKPTTIVIIGDFGDFYAVSSHDKSPERANRFDEELDVIESMLDELDGLGATDKLYIEGNHEDRLRRYLMKDASLHSRRITTQALLKLDERGWEFVPYKHHAARGAIHYTHDVGVAGRNAVFKALDTYQHSVVSGHTHRLGYVVEGTAIGGSKISATFGWGGDVEAVEYMNLARARKDWALGFGVGYHDPASGYVYLTPIPVVDGTVCVNGTLYRAA